MKNAGSLGIMIGVFITIIIGLTLVPTIADNVFVNTNTMSTVNETLTVSAKTGTLSNDDLVSITYIGNTTNDLTANLSTASVNYSTSTGVVTFESKLATHNYNVSYTYYPDDYVKNGAARSLIGLITIFFVLGVIAVGFLFVKNLGWF